MNSLQQRTQALFLTQFGYGPDLIAQAPGRVNLIGEHTDYNDGFVLPCAINYYTVVCAAARSDTLVRVVAADYGDAIDEFDVSDTLQTDTDPDRGWVNYVRGMLQVARVRGYPIAGLDLVIAGDVPQGAGLSSSASLEMALAETLSQLFTWSASKSDLALLGQAAENDFVGCQCGIMDQYISAMGREQQALLIDCRSLEARAVTIPPGTQIVIVNSNVRRGLVDSEYNSRRQQCEAAAKQLGVKALRDVSVEMLNRRATELEPLVLRRARHVVTENERVLQAEMAMNAADLPLMARLMAQSHVSMRDDFEITVPPIDTLVEMIKDELGEAGGVRMTGGGFGGCVVAVLPTALLERVTGRIERDYFNATGLQADIHVCTAVDGMGAL
ncbi:MAG: galactokinase [Candidatus Azotimanducaceae bacterium]|jgi:galactokinase